MMDGIRNYFKKYFKWILWLGILILIIILNFEPGEIVMGLDNISPWFGEDINLHRMFNSGNFFLYGPLFFNPVIHLLNIVSLPSWLVSQIFVFFSFFTGVFFCLKILEISTKDDLNRFGLASVSLLSLLGTLISIWVFNQPNLIFISMFAGFPAVLYGIVCLLLKKEVSLFIKIWIIVGLGFFLTTSLNLVTFLLGLSQLLILGGVLVSIIQGISVKLSFLHALKYIGMLFLVWVVLIQILLFFTNDRNFIGVEIYNLVFHVKDSSITHEVTEQLRRSEIKNNSLLNTLRFAGGWLEMHDTSGEPVFQYYDKYMNSYLMIVAGLIPFIFIAVTSYKSVAKDNKYLVLYAVFWLSFIFMSRYFSLITKNIPLFKDAFRWFSSKFWQITFILTPVLLVRGLVSISRRTVKYLWVGLLLCSYVLSSFPWWVGNISSDYVMVDLPEEYYYLNRISSESKILYSPAPQALYFRQYKWYEDCDYSYYGSDFISYLTKAEVMDISGVSEYSTKYENYTDSINTCEIDDIRDAQIDYYIYDKSVVGKGEYDIVKRLEGCSDLEMKTENEYFVVWIVR